MSEHNDKIVSREELRRRTERWKRDGEKVILTNGCFDLLHVGHIRYFHAAKQLGGKLVVALNADESVRRLKGAGRPVMNERERAEILAALADIDAIVIFPEPDVRAIIAQAVLAIQSAGTIAATLVGRPTGGPGVDAERCGMKGA